MTAARKPSRFVPHSVVRASAGSGKTYLLAVRYLRLLHDGADPGSILATTFTRKAAGEILQRVLGRLADVALDASGKEAKKLSEDLNKGLPADRHRPLDREGCLRLLEKLCGQLHRLSIGTIDAFLSRVVGCYRHELGLAAGMTMLSPGDPLDQELRRQAIEAVLSDGDDLPAVLELLQRLRHDHSRSIMQDIERITSSLYDLYREAPDAAAWEALTPPPSRLKTGEVQEHVLAMQRLREADWSKRLNKALESDYHVAAAQDWETFPRKGLAAKIAEAGADALYYGDPIPPEIIAVYEPLVAHARAELIGRVADRAAAMHDLLEHFDRHYLRLRYEQGLLLFSDLTWLLGQAMDPPTTDTAQPFSLDDLYYRLDARVQHLLLDEFQDTSPSQWRVLRPLAEEIAAHGDGSRRLLCVGDVKQSIYGWRGGCAEIFSRVVEDLHLPADAIEHLHVSYRSSPVILDTVNKLFVHLPANPALAGHTGAAETWIEGFEQHEPAHRDRPGFAELCIAPGSAITPADADAPANDAETDDEGDDAPGDHGYLRWMARRIADLARQAPTAGFGVLLRKNNDAGTLIHLLRQEGLPVSGEGGSTLLDDAGVNLILAALRLADHPGDTAAAYHVRVSPLGPVVGLEDDNELQAEVAARRIRRELLEEGYGRVVGRWARTLIPYADARGRARLSQLCALADRHGPRATLRPGDFLEIVRATKVEEPSPARVRVMTIHAAKGLEFDVVVLPELDGRLFPRSPAFYAVRPDPTEPPTAIYAGANKDVRKLCPELEAAHQQEERRQLHDELCTLYVAMTRARHALHMFVKPRERTQKGLHGRQLCLANILVEGLRQNDEPAADAITDETGHTLFAHGNPDWAKNLDRKSPSPADESSQTGSTLGVALTLPMAPSREQAGLLDRRAWARISPSSLEKRGAIPAADLLAVAPRDDSPATENSTRRQGLQRGRLWHLWLSTIEWLDKVTPLPTDAQWLAAAVREFGPQPAGEDWPTLAAELRRKLRTPGLRKILTRPPNLQPVDLWCERRFAIRLQGTLVTGVFDRVVVQRCDGAPISAELWDYKTDRLPDGTASILRLVEIYRPQMLSYRDALATMLKLPASAITARLLFLDGPTEQAVHDA
ncbi:MAG: UvrD-helicase domain-containing protein [Phycisphaeraceae bacterium]|nr:UvrD-helicase domain-containing protein [Phycisphaeraceae bacterium]